MARDPDYDEYCDAIDERIGRYSHMCKCGFEMPGTCPGPASCPLQQPDEESASQLSREHP